MTIYGSIAILCLAVCSATGAAAQAPPHAEHDAMPPMMDSALFAHALLDRLEGRVGAARPDLRWQGQAWFGGDRDKLWIKSEGFLKQGGKVEDGRHELLWDRAVFRYMDVQAGVRADLDSGRGRSWAALGVQGMAPLFLDYEATAYLGDRGHAAVRVAASYDLPIAGKLILRPEVEANAYSKADPGRGVGAGFADIEVGLRLRYEIERKFAPYLGVAYAEKFGQTARLSSERGGAFRFVFGIRSWI